MYGNIIMKRWQKKTVAKSNATILVVKPDIFRSRWPSGHLLSRMLVTRPEAYEGLHEQWLFASFDLPPLSEGPANFTSELLKATPHPDRTSFIGLGRNGQPSTPEAIRQQSSTGSL